MLPKPCTKLPTILGTWLLGWISCMAATPTTAETADDGGYNLILISATNTRADHLGTYGYFRATSPELDQFARRSIVFRNAFTHASWTLPVAVSLFTSQYPFAHKLMNREENPVLPSNVPTLIDALNSAGYLTAAFVGDRDYSPKHGHTSRFRSVYDSVKDGIAQDWKSYGVFGKTLPAAREWLRAHHTNKFCLLVQGYDTHCPFAIPTPNPMFDPNYRGSIDFTKCYWTFEPTRPIGKRSPTGEYQNVYVLKTKPNGDEDFDVMFYPEDVKHMIALYDGEIHNVDRMLGDFFHEIDQLGLSKNTIIVFYSDHGDMFGKHGRFMRGGPLRGTFYDDVLRIPLIVYHPKLKPQSVDGLVQVIDLAPTLLDWLKLPTPDTFVGKSALPLLRGEPINRYTFAGSSFTPANANPFFKYPSVIMAARDLDQKMIVERVVYPTGPKDTVEFYNLKQDPEELTNRASQQPDRVNQLRGELNQWLSRLHATNFILKASP